MSHRRARSRTINPADRQPLADVDALWYVGSLSGRAAVESASAGNMKRTWTHSEPAEIYMDEALREATHIKNIWLVQSPSGGKQGPSDW